MALLNRIVSLVPSTTKTLYDLGLGQQIIGITSFCVEPPSLYKSATIVGGTKDPNLDLIANLNPTHVFANSEENTQDIVDSLRKTYPVHLSQPRSSLDVICFLQEVPDFLGQSLEYAQSMIQSISGSLATLRSHITSSHLNQKTFLYFIWDQPLMVAGIDTYISSLLEETGLRNALHGANDSSRYPAISFEALNRLKADVLLFSSEPFPFKNRHIKPILEKISYSPPSSYKIDGRLMSWHGSLTEKALRELVSWQRGDPVDWLSRVT